MLAAVAVQARIGLDSTGTNVVLDGPLDLGTNPVTFGGVTRTNWPGGADASSWSAFPATGTVSFGSGGLTNSSTNGPTVAENGAAGAFDWSNPNSALVEDGAVASVWAASNAPSKDLILSSFGFSVPTNQTIRGIVVKIKGACMPASFTPHVRLTSDAVTSLTNTPALTTDTNALAWCTNGAASDLWGVAWTPVLVNSTNFAVKIWGDPGLGSDFLQVDYVTVEIHYGFNIVTISTGGVAVIPSLQLGTEKPISSWPAIPTLGTGAGQAFPGPSGLSASNLAHSADTNAETARRIATNALGVANAALPASGGTMGGNINMGGNTISGGVVIVSRLQISGGSPTNGTRLMGTNTLGEATWKIPQVKQYILTTRTTNNANVTVSGIGFRPRWAEVRAYVNNSVVGSIGSVASDGSQSCLVTYNSPLLWSGTTDQCAVLVFTGFSWSLTWSGWTDDGATFSQAKATSPTNDVIVQMMFFE